MGKTLVTLLILTALLLPAAGYAQGRPAGPPPVAQEAAGEILSQGDPEGMAAYYVWYAEGASEKVQAGVASLGGHTTFEFDPALVPALAVVLPQANAVEMNTLDGVTFMEPVPEHRLIGVVPSAVRLAAQEGGQPLARKPQVVPWNVDQVQARDVWDVDRDGIIDPGAPDGSGVKFCIIDTGFYRAHDDHQGVVADGYSQISGEYWWQDGNGHGTHVAGTANAQNNSYGVVGVMPGGAELYIVKIFNNAGEWVTGESNLGSAAQRCRDAGANALSMSLGGGYSTTENNIFQGLYDNNNIINIAAAGNDGNTVKSYPASYNSVISVAALTEQERWATFSQYPATSYDPNNPPANVHWDAVELGAGGQGVLSTVPSPNGDIPQYEITVDGVTYAGFHIDESAYGSPSAQLVDGGLCNSTNGAWSGKIVLCARGDIAFADKVNNVRNSGGLGTAIYNNVEGDFLGTCGGNCTQPSIPAISLSQADGQYLVANKLGLAGDLVVDSGATSCPECVGGYDFYDGTSMATPGVAAGVAWVWGSCGGPAGITNKQLRQLLRDSAKDLVLDGGVGWDAKTGWGLIQLKDALNLGNERFGATCPLILLTSPPSRHICTLFDTSTTFQALLNESFVGTTNMTMDGHPAGTIAAFDPNPVVSPIVETVLTISGLDQAAPGSYTLNVVATDSSNPDNLSQGAPVLVLYTDTPASAALVVPADGAVDVLIQPTFSWQAAAQAQNYDLQIAANPDFTQGLRQVGGLTSLSYTLDPPALEPDNLYYWRVRANNMCGETYSAVYAFRTSAALECTNIIQNGGFDSGTAPWNQSTSGLIQTTNPRSPAYAALLGGSKNADHWVRQVTTDDPAATVKTLTYWYDIRSTDGNCTNDVGYVIVNQSTTVRTQALCSTTHTGYYVQQTLDLSGISNITELRFRATTNNSGNDHSSFYVDDVGLQVCRPPTPVGADYSDLPGSYGVAWHTGPCSPRLGAECSAGSDFGPGAGDENDDGVALLGGVILPGTNMVRVTVNDAAPAGHWLRMWVDWNGDGAFEELTDGELVYDNLVHGGPNDFEITAPASLPTPLYYRVRLYGGNTPPGSILAQDGSSYGGAMGGEVEDDPFLQPLAVKLTSFDARPAVSGVLLTWETASELDNAGFFLYRSTTLDERGGQLNEELIPSAVPGGDGGAAYEFLDAGAASGVAYYYTLEDVDVFGQRTAHGPVMVTPWRAYLPVVSLARR